MVVRLNVYKEKYQNNSLIPIRFKLNFLCITRHHPNNSSKISLLWSGNLDVAHVFQINIGFHKNITPFR